MVRGAGMAHIIEQAEMYHFSHSSPTNHAYVKNFYLTDKIFNSDLLTYFQKMALKMICEAVPLCEIRVLRLELHLDRTHCPLNFQTITPFSLKYWLYAYKTLCKPSKMQLRNGWSKSSDSFFFSRPMASVLNPHSFHLRHGPTVEVLQVTQKVENH